jgi:hypothetical protein
MLLNNYWIKEEIERETKRNHDKGSCTNNPENGADSNKCLNKKKTFLK